MSIFELMAHYIPHKNFRSRLGMNSAASNIWICWLLSGMCFVTAVALLFRAEEFLFVLGLMGAGAVLFALSFSFLPEAMRLHEIKRITKNEILFGETTHEV